VIGTRIAAQFGPRTGLFPQISELANADGYKLEDRALMCTTGDLEVDSSLFREPGSHRASPWCRTTLRLATVAEARERYNAWAANEFDRVHSGPQEKWIDEHGVMHDRPRPANPYREKAAAP
jgi:hypothetical protein